ncbi:MAG: cyclic peptide export ABC transporter [Gammaproteobacteria bacterium]
MLLGLLLFALPAIHEVSHAVLTGFVLPVLYMLTPLTVVLTNLPEIGRGVVAGKKVQALGLALGGTGDEDHATDAKNAVNPVKLELLGVFHAYQDEREPHNFTLGPIDLVIEPGELLFVTGGNGSGKTTLALLIAGLYAPEKGEIRLNGRLITEANREDYRQHFSAVFSDAYLFESLLGTADNGDTLKQADDLLVRMQLDHKVRIQGHRFSSVELSQGQRKRLALLAAYLEDRPVCLFDEWAADQDPLFKAIFYTELVPQLKARGKTVIVITHDEQYYHVADRCVRLISGRLAPLPLPTITGDGRAIRLASDTGY